MTMQIHQVGVPEDPVALQEQERPAQAAPLAKRVAAELPAARAPRAKTAAVALLVPMAAAATRR
jgi:hypothetical protein